jgi:hypothetical protein
VPIVEIPRWQISVEATTALVASYEPHLLAARLLPEVVAAEMVSPSGPIAAIRSPVRGEVFRYRDRTPLADARYLLRRAFGHARLAPRPERIVWAPPSPFAVPPPG